jgi:very-short-patch-repair endonuclease
VIEDESGGFVARVDFAYPEMNVVIELDGFAYHSYKTDFQRDRTRQNLLMNLGYTVLRFTYWDVLAGSDYVVDTLATLLSKLRD